MWGQAMDRPQMDRGQCAKSLRTRQRRRSDTREACVRREEGYFGERLEECLLVLQVGVEIGAQLLRPWVQACRRKTPRAVATLGGNPACGGLWPFQLIQLIHLRYLCGSAEREKRMDVCFLLTLYIQYIIKFGGCQKWKVEENGRDGKIWKARDCGRWRLREVCVGRNGREVRWLPPKVPFLTFLRFYDILTVFSRESRKRGTENVCIR